MLREFKRAVKNLLTLVFHPILFVHIHYGGGKNVVFGKKLRMNTVKYLCCGSNVTICSNARFLFVDSYRGQTYNPDCYIGDNVYIAYNFTLMAAAPIRICKNVLIASDVVISSENHGINPEVTDSYADTPLDGQPVEIGEGCWLGEKVIILPGVTLGKRCVVAASAVVTKSFPDYSMIAGIPAKCIKRYNLVSHEWDRV